MIRASLAALLLTSGPALAERVEAYLTEALVTCIRTLPLTDQTRAAFEAAGYAYTPEDFGGGDILHWYAAPSGAGSVAVIDTPGAPECRVTTTRMGTTAAIARTGEILDTAFPGVFTYGNMENTAPVTPGNMGDRWVDCTGYVGWAGQRAITIHITSTGNDPACFENGTSSVSVRY